MKERLDALSRRELPARGSFSTPHVQCFATAAWLHSNLEREVAKVHARAASEADEALHKVAIEGALKRHGLSEAVQVFCAMTAEAATNLLAVLVLGEKQFLSIEEASVAIKIRRLFELIHRSPIPPKDELLIIAHRLFTARNSFVHPKPQEGQLRPTVRERVPDLDSARAAIDDARNFLTRLQALDAQYAVFLTLL